MWLSDSGLAFYNISLEGTDMGFMYDCLKGLASMMEDNEIKASRNFKVVATILIVMLLVFPLLIVQVFPTDSPQPYIFKAEIIQKLDETMQGKLRYFLVEKLEGSSPADDFVVTIDEPYTRGGYLVELEGSQQIWMQGDLMTQDVFYGEQYLFFGYDQLYISQIKTGALWPDQITELKILYLSPFTAFTSLMGIFWYPFSEEYSLRNYLAMIAHAMLIVTLIILSIKTRARKRSLTLIILTYSVLVMAATIPMLYDLY
jgi:hypothetical protein